MKAVTSFSLTLAFETTEGLWQAEKWFYEDDLSSDFYHFAEFLAKQLAYGLCALTEGKAVVGITLNIFGVPRVLVRGLNGYFPKGKIACEAWLREWAVDFSVPPVDEGKE